MESRHNNKVLASHTCGLASAQAHLFPQPLGASTSWNLHSRAAYSSNTSHFLLHSQHKVMVLLRMSNEKGEECCGGLRQDRQIDIRVGRTKATQGAIPTRNIPSQPAGIST